MTVVVKKRPGESDEQMLNRFRKKTRKRVKKIRDKQVYKKPSQEKRERKQRVEFEHKLRAKYNK